MKCYIFVRFVIDLYVVVLYYKYEIIRENVLISYWFYCGDVWVYLVIFGSCGGVSWGIFEWD